MASVYALDVGPVARGISLNAIEKIKHYSAQSMFCFFMFMIFEIIIHQTIFMLIPTLCSLIVFLIVSQIEMIMDE